MNDDLLGSLAFACAVAGAKVLLLFGHTACGAIKGAQFHHVIDIAPTVLEAAQLPQPTFVNGVQQKPIEGVSMLYSFDDAKAADRHETQYFEFAGNRGIYHKGWTAVTHRTWRSRCLKNCTSCSAVVDRGHPL